VTTRRARRARTAVAVAVALAAVPLAAARAAAAGGGQGVDVLCSRADFGCVAGTGYHGQSVWGANYGKAGHNCTSYVSFRLAQAGVAEPWHTMGNAGQWDDRGAGKVPVDRVPAVGAVAQWEGGTRYSRGSSGHVAFVESITPTSIEITEDQHGGGTRRLVIHQGSPYWPSHFVHIHDRTPQAPMTLGHVDLTNGLRTPTSPPTRRVLGAPGDLVVAGDWNGDGRDSLGTFRDGTWVLYGRRGMEVRTSTLQLGAPGDVPVVGDWDGDGRDDLGVFRAGEWILRTPTRTDPAHVTELRFGAAGDTPVVGDWDGNGTDGIGLFNAGHWTLTNDLHSSPATYDLTFGQAGDHPVAGDWNGNGRAGIGYVRAGTWVLTSSLAPWWVGTPSRTLNFGATGAAPLVGNWDGHGADGVGAAE
jgi:surface antigen